MSILLFLIPLPIVGSTTVDRCATTCSITPNCVSSHCMDFKLPAVCHGIVVRPDGSLCSADDGPASCSGQPAPCDKLFPSEPYTTTPTVTTNSVTTEVSTYSTTTSTTYSSDIFDYLIGTWCNTRSYSEGIMSVVTFLDEDDVLILYEGVTYAMKYTIIPLNKVIISTATPPLDLSIEKYLTTATFFVFFDASSSALISHLKGEANGNFFKSDASRTCGPLTTPDYITTSLVTTPATPTGPTFEPTGLSGVWCGRAGDKFEAIRFTGNTFAVTYFFENYYMQYYWAGNQMYVYDADPADEEYLSGLEGYEVDFSLIRMEYYVDKIYLYYDGKFAGIYTRGSSCGRFAGRSLPPTIGLLSYRKFCSERDTGLPYFEVRFTQSYMTLQVFTDEYFTRWDDPILPAKYSISYSDIRLIELDNGFETLTDFAQGNFRLVYYDTWLKLIFENGENAPHIKLNSC
ncbi:hypothetical protein FOL47_009611 [Perkinsus chesapeaki]|uniref:Uncharacterized protein n=1 Tax=Perkinsus chesapeaki TaxID=330153 RepID=A0A7J6L7B4_PERCH|nr:hypothetical protein FOL47_009611 [Perkinsus chesapeaki]